jgi:segregation and condensation protein A
MKPELTIVQNVAANAPAKVAAPEQDEMPFAVVEGQPITEMPRDLYIPPQALEVFLEAFEGPLDMLLYLIRRQNLDILDIPIAEITRQYMRYIELMQVLQLELAGEYLLMAATLAEVKSRMLLPRLHSDDAPAGARHVARLRGFGRSKGGAHRAAGHAAGNAVGLPRSAVAQ